jgi:hypothetical protein
MPRVKVGVPGRRPFTPGEMCRAISAAYVAGDEGAEFYVHTGDRYSADHEVVKAIPDNFIPDDQPTDQIAAWLPEVVFPSPDPSRFNIAEPPAIPDERKVICLESLGDFTEQITKGQIVDVRHRFVSQWPGYFSAFKPLDGEDVERLSR